MSESAPFSLLDLVMATTVALLVQIGFFVLLRTNGGTTLHADLSDDNAKPMSVAITPVVDDAPLLKLGSKRQKHRLPDRWMAPKPVARTTAHATPSTLAKATPDAIPSASVLDAGAKPPPDTELAKQTDAPLASANTPPPVSSVEGAADGVKEGTETDPLKARQVDLYKARLNQWFSQRILMRGKLPFDTLKTLAATVSIQVSPNRQVAGFTIVQPSGNPVFDQTLTSSLESIKASGLELPPPPAMYPDVLGQTLSIHYTCKDRSRCQ